MNRRSLLILTLFATSFVLGSCVKGGDDPYGNGSSNNCIPNNTGIPTSAEIASLQSYLTANSISAALSPQGFFYIIVAPGSGPTPNLTSQVTVKYTGTLMNGTIFDTNQTGYTNLLSGLILGFQKGLPLIQKGGSIKLYLPPSLAYGCNQIGIVTPGSNLIFTVDLIDVF